MKTSILRYFSIAILFLFLIACSTKRNSWVSRNMHALSARDNILYNGKIALDKGIVDLKGQYNDNFWEPLPIERMQVKREDALVAAPAGQDAKTNPNFERAETKATKAIQKHSMNIGGSEKNPQMDEAHLLLGKARYYDQRFVPALEAFNYILYKYPNSNRIYEAKIWREKTNIRMNNDALAVNNLTTLLKEIKFKDQIFADANAILSQAFLNLEERDSAVAKLKLARDFTKSKEEKARYRFILGQLFEEAGQKDSAFVAYQEVIDMKRKAPRQYVVYAHIRQAGQFDAEKGDTIAFLKKFNSLLKDRENRPFLGVLNHQMALFYDKNKKVDIAKKYYNTSLKYGIASGDKYLTASNYRNLADIYFNKAKYVTAGKYFDSTLVQLDAKSREFKAIKKKRENLVDVIKYEGIATRNDSIIKVYGLSETEKIAYYNEHIEKLKKAEETQKAKDRENAALENPDDGAGKNGADALDANGRTISREAVGQRQTPPEPTKEKAPEIGGAPNESNFYFYNPTTVAFGKAEFRKTWGTRTLKNNWRLSGAKAEASLQSEDEEVENTAATNEKGAKDAKDVKSDELYTADYYIKKLPKSQTAIDSIAKERNFAYYQLGVIYKEKFKEYQLAANKLETLLENRPEERLVLPSMYNLYKIYEIINKDKALAMKEQIISRYPDSRYAQILGNTNSGNAAITDTPEASYAKMYKRYLEGDYKKVLVDSGAAIDQFTGEEIVPKFELMKAHTIGKIKGLDEYKKALNFVALNYPNSEEGKQAEALLATDVPKMEALKFYEAKPLSWKILYKADNPEDKNTIKLLATIKKFLA
ncbi:MAG TPA: tetratricopeptide repeat protein, partial [Flavobacterium sp.]|nr:tetratricopeptide repeat protein [Flavobacterium sp.]